MRDGAMRRAMRLEVLQRADAHRDVDAFLERIDEPVRQHQLHFERRIEGHELRDRIAEIHGAERHRRVDAQNPARLVVQPRHLRFGLFHLRKDGVAALEVGEPRLGGRHAPRRPVQQAGAERLLELHDRLADRRPR